MRRLTHVLTAAAAVLCSASGTSLTLAAPDVLLEVGEPLHLDCGVSGHYRHCLWETEDGRVYQVKDVHGGRHAGLRASSNLTHNQCGILVERASLGDAGAWTCTVFLEGEALRAVTNVINKDGSSCLAPFESMGGGCFYFVEHTTMSWFDARTYCKTLRTEGDLAVVNDCYLMYLLWDHIITNFGSSDHWLGATDKHQEGNWVWVDGSPVALGTPFWKFKQPNNYKNEECLQFGEDEGGYYNDYECVNKRHFICQDFAVSS